MLMNFTRPKERPSGHYISDRFAKDNGGAIIKFARDFSFGK